jgi:hypothetical protein
LFRRAAPAKIAFIDFLDHDPKFRNEIRFGTRSANSAIVRGNRTSGTKDLLGDNVGFTGFWKRATKTEDPDSKSFGSGAEFFWGRRHRSIVET